MLHAATTRNAAIRRNAGTILSQGLGRSANSGSLLGSMLELKSFFGGLPSRVNSILDAVANAEIEVKVRVVDANAMVEGFQKITNRITTGIVLAAPIVGAALLMRVTIFVQDRKKRRKTTIGVR